MGLDGQRVTKAVAVTTFAHEIGHNLGAPHDPETRECSPGPPGGQYLMYAHSTIGYLDNNKKFSECSMDYLAKSMDRILVRNCLEKQGDGGICGNRLVEPGEQCDCGNEQQCQQSNDRCCYPSDFADDSSLRCTLRQGAVCSLSQGQCCDPRSCGFMAAGTVCGDLPDGCQNERSACDGSSVQCLNKPRNWLPDGTLCQSEAIATCEDGRCVGSVCAFFGLSQCTRPISKDAFRKAEFKERFRMCRVHCLVGSECVDSADFNESLCQSHIDCSRGFMQRSGSICADGLGFCDIFKICRAVDHEGAFDRLRGIVNDRFLKRPNQNWTVYATSVLVAMIASVILVRLCGQKPSALRRSPGNV